MHCIAAQRTVPHCTMPRRAASRRTAQHLAKQQTTLPRRHAATHRTALRLRGTAAFHSTATHRTGGTGSLDFLYESEAALAMEERMDGDADGADGATATDHHESALPHWRTMVRSAMPRKAFLAMPPPPPNTLFPLKSETQHNTLGAATAPRTDAAQARTHAPTHPRTQVSTQPRRLRPHG